VKRVASIAERERRVVSFIVGCMGGEGGGGLVMGGDGRGKRFGR